MVSAPEYFDSRAIADGLEVGAEGVCNDLGVEVCVGSREEVNGEPEMLCQRIEFALLGSCLGVHHRNSQSDNQLVQKGHNRCLGGETLLFHEAVHCYGHT